MLKPIDQSLWTLADVLDSSIYNVRLEHGDYLIVSLGPVDHSQPSDRAGFYKEVTMSHRLFSQNADVDWVAVPFDVPDAGSHRTKFADRISAVSLRYESIRGRA